jgi:hypothetical protein
MIPLSCHTKIMTNTQTKIHRLSTAEVAKIVRNELTSAFPGVRFSVRSKSYSGGSSIDVNWTGGPIIRQAEAIYKKFEGATFDSMQDLKGYKGAREYKGERVVFGVDFIFGRRELNTDQMTTCAHRVAAIAGLNPPIVTDDGFGARPSGPDMEINLFLHDCQIPADSGIDGVLENVARDTHRRGSLHELIMDVARFTSF